MRPYPATATPTRRGLWVLGLSIRTERKVFAGALLGSALYGSMTVGAAWAVGWATDHVVLPAFSSHHTSAGTLAAGGLLIVGVAVAKVLGIFGRRLLAGVLQFRMQARYRRMVTAAYLRLPLAWHQQRPTGRLLSNANSDVEMSFMPIAPMPMSLGVLVMLAMAIVDMLLTNSVLAVIGILLIPAVIATNTVYVRYSGPRFARAQELRAHVAEVAHESFDGALVVKTLGREAAETERFAARTRLLRDANIAAGRARSLFNPILEALPNLGVLAVLLFGTREVAAGQAQPGDVVNIAYLITLLAFPIQAIGWVLGDLPRAVVGYERVAAVLAAEDRTEYGTAAARRDGSPAALEFDRVEFAYPGAESAPVLRALTAAIEPGRTVALVGATGAGKSTLAALLARLADPTGGAIRLDGTELAAYAKGEVSDAVALVPQQTFIFGDTVRANVALGADVGEEAVWAALRTAQAEKFVKALPFGLDTVIGERGTTLSGGQRQRLALARALVRRPRLLVLDDCTSAVDPSVEAAILDGLREQGAGSAEHGEGSPGQREGAAGQHEEPAGGRSTVVVIAYRKATVALADEVLFLADGAISARGTHEQLLERSAGYRELITAYAKAAEDAEHAEQTDNTTDTDTDDDTATDQQHQHRAEEVPA